MLDVRHHKTQQHCCQNPSEPTLSTSSKSLNDTTRILHHRQRLHFFVDRRHTAPESKQYSHMSQSYSAQRKEGTLHTKSRRHTTSHTWDEMRSTNLAQNGWDWCVCCADPLFRYRRTQATVTNARLHERVLYKTACSVVAGIRCEANFAIKPQRPNFLAHWAQMLM